MTQTSSLIKSEQFRPADYNYQRIQIETYSLCNMKCTFCPYPLRLDKENKLEDEYVYQILDSVESSKGFEYVSFHQFNEPLIDPRLFDFMQYSKKKNLPVLLITNALLLTRPSIRKKLIESSPENIKLSIQTITEDRHVKHRGTTVSFKDYVGGISAFLREFEESGSTSQIVIDIACNFHNWSDLVKNIFGWRRGDPSVVDKLSDLETDLYPFLQSLFPGEDITKRVNRDEIHNTFKILTLDYNADPAIHLGRQITFKVKPFIYGRRISDAYPLKQMAPCPSNFLGVLADGSVVPCCLVYDKDLDQNLVMGNIKQNGLKEILDRNVAKLNEIRTGTFNSVVCRKCQGSTSKCGVIVKDVKYSLARIFNRNQVYTPPYMKEILESNG